MEFAYKNSVSTASSLAPKEVHMGRLPRLPLAVFGRSGAADHQSLARDHLHIATWRRNTNSAPTAQLAKCMCFDRFSYGTANLSPFERFASGSQTCGG